MAEHRDTNENLDDDMERDAEVRRDTQVRDALGPIEGTSAERDAADSALSPEERGRVRRGSGDDRMPAAHVERGIHSDTMMDIDPGGDDVRSADRRE